MHHNPTKANVRGHSLSNPHSNFDNVVPDSPLMVMWGLPYICHFFLQDQLLPFDNEMDEGLLLKGQVGDGVNPVEAMPIKAKVRWLNAQHAPVGTRLTTQ